MEYVFPNTNNQPFSLFGKLISGPPRHIIKVRFHEMTKLKYDTKRSYFNYLASQKDILVLLVILNPYIVIGI